MSTTGRLLLPGSSLPNYWLNPAGTELKLPQVFVDDSGDDYLPILPNWQQVLLICSAGCLLEPDMLTLLFATGGRLRILPVNVSEDFQFVTDELLGSVKASMVVAAPLMEAFCNFLKNVFKEIAVMLSTQASYWILRTQADLVEQRIFVKSNRMNRRNSHISHDTATEWDVGETRPFGPRSRQRLDCHYAVRGNWSSQSAEHLSVYVKMDVDAGLNSNTQLSALHEEVDSKTRALFDENAGLHRQLAALNHRLAELSFTLSGTPPGTPPAIPPGLAITNSMWI